MRTLARTLLTAATVAAAGLLMPAAAIDATTNRMAERRIYSPR